MSDTAIYVYCVVELESTRLSGVPPGLPGATRPEPMDLGRGLLAVVADVPLARYGQDRIEAGLRDLTWVADIAVAHESVVEYVASRRGATVIPMKLFTLYLSRERAFEELAGSRRTLAAAIRRVRGCDEWGIRAMQSAPGRARPRQPIAASKSGAAFLAARKRARDDARDAAREAIDAAESAYDLLAPFSKAARRRTDVPPSAAAPPLLDAAFLVPAVRKAGFRAAAKRAATACRAAGVELTLTGPWPAYNFVQPAGPSS
jgi:hypothetical protein